MRRPAQARRARPGAAYRARRSGGASVRGSRARGRSAPARGRRCPCCLRFRRAWRAGPHPRRSRAPPRPCGGAERRVEGRRGGAEVVERNARVGEAVVDACELDGVAGRRVVFACGALKLLGLAVAVAPEVYVADVVLNLAGFEQIAVFKEAVTRAQARLDGLFITAEHGECDELADLRGGCRVWLAEPFEEPRTL